jgi:outer membrane protein assembly factor BamB
MAESRRFGTEAERDSLEKHTMNLKMLPVAIVLLLSLAIPANASESATAALALREAGRKNGLCLVVGETDGKLTAALAKASSMYVQGCTRSSTAVQPARKALVAAGVVARSSIVLRESAHLPYADNLINLLVCANLGKSGVSAAEVLRVLTPGGVALLGGAGSASAALKKAGGKGTKATRSFLTFTKPLNQNMDVWTHNLGGPDMSYVNSDKAAGPWAGIRWVADPRWGALTAAYHGRVTAGGQLYYIENRAAPGGKILAWLVARDAWNGCELWRLPAGPLPKYSNVGATLTCDESRVYCVEDNKTLIARDGRSGRKLREYAPGFRPTVVTSMGSVLLTCDMSISPAVATRVAALEKKSGRLLWKRPGIAHPPAENGTAFVLTAKDLEAVNVATGASRWKVKITNAPGRARSFCKAGVIYVTYTRPWKPMGLMVAYDAKTGALLWKKESPRCGYGALPYADELWMLTRMKTGGKGNTVQVCVLDPRTGSIKREFRAKGTVNGKCYPTKGSGDYLLYSNSWTLKRKDGITLRQDTVRAPCTLGQMPANGMTYYLPHHCDCQVTLRGMLAMAREGTRKWLPNGGKGSGPRLFASASAPAALAERPDDWPMYRRDIARSNFTPAKLPGKLKPLWSEKLGESRLTQTVSAYGIVCTTEPQAHRVFARDAASGKELWSFVADGRTEWPPALHRGLCLFSTGAGSVYALDAKTGKKIWRLRAAPAEKYIAEESQFASAWPVIGGVMPMDGKIFFASGRSVGADGGMWIFAADAATGKVRWRRRGGSSGDIFASDGKKLMLTRTFYQISNGARIGGATRKKLPGLLHATHYLGNVSVLDYMACVEPLLSSQKHIELTDGRITGEALAFSKKLGVAAWRYRFGVPKKMMKKKRKNQRFLYATGGGKNKWLLDENIKQQMVGVVLAGETAYMAGLPVSLDPKDKSELWVLSGVDGKRLQTISLGSRPVYDGLSAAGGRLYLATENGTLTCYGK